MAKLLTNSKGFLIIKMCWREYVAVSDTFGLCDLCGQNSCEEDLFFVAVLNQVYCPTCYKAWYDGAKRYSSEMQKEQLAFVEMKNKLNDLGVWDV